MDNESHKSDVRGQSSEVGLDMELTKPTLT